jgi:hypothetical protein
VSTRRIVAVFPSVANATWAIVGPVASGEDDPIVFRRALSKLKTNPDWQLVYSSAGISVLKHRD